ncbi:MAG: stage II sporulation protein M [Eubacteriales bacterium]|nr:stage II sporulation protein M [Eubacteriales bacterium]
MRFKRKGEFPAGILFLCGFLIGSLLPNIAWKLQWQQKTMASVYLLGAFAHSSVSGKEYFFEVLRMRGSYFLLCILCGVSVFGVPLAVLGVIILGVEIGAMLTMSILQFGLAGGAVGLGLLFPQYLVYIPVSFFFMALVYQQSLDIWRNHGIFPQKAYRYGTRACVAAVLYFGGIVLESYCNPWIVEKIFGALKIF